MFAVPVSSISLSAVARRVIAVALALLLAAAYGPVSGEPRIVEYTELPERFEQVQDTPGGLWQVSGDGALTSGSAPYLPSGMKLFVDGVSFAPDSARLVDDSPAGGVIELTLAGKAGEIPVSRDIWLDRERGGVRLVDTLNNPGKKPLTVRIELKTGFRFPWQNLVGTSGRLLPSASPVLLSRRDRGLAIRFAATDGREDTVLLMRGGEASALPAISASANARELVLAYEVELPAGERRSLLHWVVRRNLGDSGELADLMERFYSRRLLVDARVPGDLVETVVNFASSDFPGQQGPPPGLRNLAPLNEQTDRIGVHRRSQDILWLSPRNQLIGEVSRNARVEIEGEKVGVEAIAAIQGGGGMGRIPRVFLRDGRVQAGKVRMEEFSMKIGADWTLQRWEPDQLNFLLFAWDSSDGIPPKKARFFMELRSGDVLAVSDFPDGFSIETAWGRNLIAVDRLSEIRYTSRPWPEYRIRESSGSIYGGLVTGEALRFVDHAGVAGAVSPDSLLRLWRAGTPPEPASPTEFRWAEWEDVPETSLPESGFLLSGNAVIAGTFDGEKPLVFLESGSVIEVDPASIVAMRRLPSRTGGDFEVECSGGDVIRGRLRDSFVQLRSDDRLWRVPGDQLLAYRFVEKRS